MKRLFTSLALFCLLGLVALPAWGHDYWLMPHSFTPAPGSLLEVDFTCGHKYFPNQSIPDITRFRAFLTTPEGRRLALAYQKARESEARLLVPVFRPGTYLISAVTVQPEFWSRTEKGYRPGGRAAVPGALETGKYVKSTKTFFTVGKPSQGYQRLQGYEIELLPLKNPSTLRAGQGLPVQVWFRGKPLPGVEVFAFPEGFKGDGSGPASFKAKADAKGVARLTFERTGTWLVFTRHEIDTPGAPLADRESYRAYLLLRVQ